MSKPPITTERLSPHLELSLFHDGLWLWDDTRQMNLAIREKTERGAFLCALDYYQQRVRTLECKCRNMQKAIDGATECLSELDTD